MNVHNAATVAQGVHAIKRPDKGVLAGDIHGTAIDIIDRCNDLGPILLRSIPTLPIRFAAISKDGTTGDPNLGTYIVDTVYCCSYVASVDGYIVFLCHSACKGSVHLVAVYNATVVHLDPTTVDYHRTGFIIDTVITASGATGTDRCCDHGSFFYRCGAAVDDPSCFKWGVINSTGV